MGQYVEQNLNRGEEVIKEAQRHPIALVLAWIFAVLFFWVLFIPVILAVKATITYLTTELAYTNKRIIGKVGLINTKSLDAPLNKVQSASVSSGLGGKIFKYGNVVVSTASSNLVFPYVKNPDEFKGALMNQIEIYEEEKIKEQAKQMANAVSGAVSR